MVTIEDQIERRRKRATEDIAAIGDGFVMMHGMVKKLSNPEVIQFLEKLTDLPTAIHLDEVKPVGPVGLMLGMRSQEAQAGLGVLMELTRALGTLKNGATGASTMERAIAVPKPVPSRLP